MRVAPTSLDYSQINAADALGTTLTPTSISLLGSESSPQFGQISMAFSSGVTSGRNYFLQANNNSAAYLGFNAEL